MKKMRKQVLSLLLVFCMLAGIVPALTPTASAAGVSSTFLNNCSTSYKSGQYYTKLAALTLSGNLGSDLVAVAQSQVGYCESNSSSDFSGESKGSDNYTEYNRWYFGNTTNHQAWCNLFVSWCCAAAGISTSIAPKNPFYLSKWKECGAIVYSWKDYKDGLVSPAPGDIIIFADGKTSANATGSSLGDSYDHIGIIKNHGFQTVEGNISDKVANKNYTPSADNGFVYSYKSGTSTKNRYIYAIVRPSYNLCSHNSNYSSDGRCTLCGAWLPNKNDNASCTVGTYKVKSGTTGYFRLHPYKVSDEKINELLASLSAGTQVTVTGAVVNGLGNTWYKVTYGGKTGYIVATSLEFVSAPAVTVTVTTNAATNVTATSARLNGSLTASSTVHITEHGAYLGTSTSNMQKVATDIVDHDKASSTMWYDTTKYSIPLSPNTTYYYYQYAVVNGATYKGSVVSFKTAALTVSVTLNANGGSVSPASIQVTYGGTYSGLPTPTRSGYSFNGWYTASSGGTQVTSSSTVTATSNHTLYAQWTANKYTVNFAANGGELEDTKARCTYDSVNEKRETNQLVLFNNGGTTTGTNEYGTEVVVSSDNRVTEIISGVGNARIPEGGFVLSAHGTAQQWISDNIAVGDYVNLHSTNANPVWVFTANAWLTWTKTVVTGNAYGNLPAPLKRNGYTFAGWYTAPEGGTQVTSATVVTASAAHTLYAHWTKDACEHVAGEAVRENEVAATCTAAGSYDEVVYCTLCGEELSRTHESTDALGHLWSAWVVSEAATCTGFGEKRHFCQRCNSLSTVQIDPLGHSWGEWITDTEPTVTSEGTKHRECANCSAVENGTIPALTPDPDPDPDPDPISEDAPTIRVSSESAKAGGTVDVTIALENNPGIVSALLEVTYDQSVLTLTNVTDAGIFGTTNHNPDLGKYPYVLSWENDTSPENFTVTGTIVTLTFAIDESAEDGEYPISVTYDPESDIFNVDMDLIEFEVAAGGVTVSSVVYGDVDGNGKVNALDRARLGRYVAKWSGYDATTCDLAAADLDQNGKVNAMDRAILARCVAKWAGYETLPYVKP